ncbi:MAG: mycothiol conjugate amidase Mca [Microthrixaceae bacterium]|nr:mycothiol conjugate amidase Mca [Microthrixaceae bacterium]MCO5317380.1 mycothiol conjugate amidase Mca [Microthrixaceae bacterium]
MNEPLRMLTVHAHPDDESSKGASTVARYAQEGIPATLVCCTGGEAGSVLNPAMDTPEVNADLAAVRREELAAATRIIGYDRVELLGYHDSGMPDSEDNARPDNFWNADMDEAIGKLVAVIRRDRPQVIVTYGDDQRHYAHPDHLRVHDITLPAFERAADPEWYPDLGDVWQPLKLYYTVWSRRRMVALHETFLRMGLESPFGEDWQKRFSETDQDDRITTQVPIRDHYEVREKALRAHATQVDPTSPFWFGLPTEVARDVHPWDDYILARSLVETDLPEDDLFAGVPGRSGSLSP